jgi:hypothetical protein
MLTGMKRRDFSAGLIASGLAGAGPLWANPDEEERRGRSLTQQMARVQLQFATRTILLTWFLITLRGGGFLGLNLTQPMPRFDENRANLGHVPLLGQLQRPLLARRFAEALFAGTLVLLGSYLILLPQIRQNLRNKKVLITNRAFSWEPPGRTGGVRVTEIPGLRQLMSLPGVGTGHLKGNELLLRVQPSIVRLPED